MSTATKWSWIIGLVLFLILGLSFIATDPADLIHTSDDGILQSKRDAGWIWFTLSLGAFLGYLIGLRVGYDDGLFKSISKELKY